MTPAMRYRRLALAAAVTLLALTASACGSHKSAAATRNEGQPIGGTVVVFAAASLKPSFTAIATAFERVHPGVKVVTSFGGSDSLATQIVQGAPVDVFAAANTSTMASVVKAHDAGAPVDFAKNSLEIAVPAGNPQHVTGLADLAKSGVTLAICADTVPCGAAAAKAFAAAAITPHPATYERDVTSVLTKVELGEVDAGLVYATDVKSAAGKIDGVNFAEAGSAVNTYPIATVRTGSNQRAGQAFVDYVLSAPGQQVLADAGFQHP